MIDGFHTGTKLSEDWYYYLFWISCTCTICSGPRNTKYHSFFNQFGQWDETVRNIAVSWVKDERASIISPCQYKNILNLFCHRDCRTIGADEYWFPFLLLSLLKRKTKIRVFYVQGATVRTSTFPTLWKIRIHSVHSSNWARASYFSKRFIFIFLKFNSMRVKLKKIDRPKTAVVHFLVSYRPAFRGDTGMQVRSQVAWRTQ